MIEYLTIYLIGCLIAYIICKITRKKVNANEEIDEEITIMLTALSWISLLFFLIIFLKEIKEKIWKHY